MREKTEQDAKLEARDYSALLGVGPLWRMDTWELGALASGGVSTFAVHGNASAPLITNATTLVRATATGSLRATHWFSEHCWGRLSGQLGWVRPIDLNIVERRTAEIGPLMWAFELSAGWAWNGSL